MKSNSVTFKVLSIDIGGTNIKVTILDQAGKFMIDHQHVDTPHFATPAHILECIQKTVAPLNGYDYISVGFPGFIKNGVVRTAPNLDVTWAGYELEKTLTIKLGKPTRVINDADMLGLGVAKGVGLELVITLGTGLGTALLLDGKLLPHLEFAHQPFGKYSSYDEAVGEKALEKDGAEKWNARVKNVLAVLRTVFNYDTLYIGGGNAHKLLLEPDQHIQIFTNHDGITGGSKLWTEVDPR